MAVTGEHGTDTGRDPAQGRIVAVLTASQILGGLGAGTGVAISSLAATSLSGSEAVGGLSQSIAVAGAAALAVPLGRLTARYGRRPALTFGYGAAATGAAVATLACATGSWPLLLAGLFLFGGGTAAGLAARYAATDRAGTRHAARDLSIVVWATTVGSVAGPNLAEPADALGRRLGLDAWSGPFAATAVAFTLTALGLFALLRPDPMRTPNPPPAKAAVKGGGSGRGGWAVLVAVSRARLAVAAMIVSHMVMVAVMTMTPVHLHHGAASLTVVGVVISLHIAGMYALSPLPGWLADRVGRLPVLIAGMAMLAVACVLAAVSSPHDVGRLTVALVLLGAGWSFGLVAGSALLTDAVERDERPAVQGLSDALMNAGAAGSSLLAGVVVTAFSYGVLATVSLALVAPMTVVLLRAGTRRPA
ncbi:MFS transporter [Actinomadura flavalba]|uniref:MFS transporter n=1 Tax=Actinomadura flavalba TaxID=1120938 RepID=UPI00035C9F24|nr:MFS transporter [Actinomadura flavalba]